MAKLEKGAIANPDEKRMVGHYWLRAPQLAPTPKSRTRSRPRSPRSRTFTAQVHSGAIAGPKGKFKHLLVIGIGGSALGPQLVSHALGQAAQGQARVSFFDNTDPDGMDYVLGLPARPAREDARPRDLEIRRHRRDAQRHARGHRAFKAAGLDPRQQFVAVTGAGSKLDQTAAAKAGSRAFPMWDWVGGRTSELCAVGLLPAALQGIDIQAMLDGAAAMDEVTRNPVTAENPRRPDRADVALRDRWPRRQRHGRPALQGPPAPLLALPAAARDGIDRQGVRSQGRVVNQGIAVYGNKGSTDQHAYVQQLREGVNNFFVTFIEVLKDRDAKTSLEVEPGVTAGDYLQGFYLGTRDRAQ
jgi:glucose-6-phosphate isomerase